MSSEQQKAEQLPLPPGATKAQLIEGYRIFHGLASNGTCSGCHGHNAKGGSNTGPDLTTDKWLWIDGSLQSLKDIIKTGVPTPKEHAIAMPPMGGSQLSPADLDAVATYVWALGHSNKD